MGHRTQELEIEQVKLAILKLARDRNLPSEVLVSALADVLGITAATLDLQVRQVPIDNRLDLFIERVKTRHALVMQRAARIPKAG